MGTTPTYGLRYPDLDDPDNVPTDMGELAIDVENALKAVAAAVLPAGALFPYAGGAPPTGFLLCDGTAVSRTTYAALFAAIGTAYGSGDGVSTFNVPNLRGRVPAGLDAGQTEFNALGKTGGEKAHVSTIAEMPFHDHGGGNHGHGVTDPSHAHALAQSDGGALNVAYQGGGAGPIPFLPPQTYNNGFVGITPSATGISVNASGATIAAQGGGGGHNNLQPFLVVGYLIKT